jgi:hypothetical protein
VGPWRRRLRDGGRSILVASAPEQWHGPALRRPRCGQTAFSSGPASFGSIGSTEIMPLMTFGEDAHVLWSLNDPSYAPVSEDGSPQESDRGRVSELHVDAMARLNKALGHRNGHSKDPVGVPIGVPDGGSAARAIKGHKIRDLELIQIPNLVAIKRAR